MRLIRLLILLLGLSAGVVQATTTTSTTTTTLPFCVCDRSVTNTVYADGLETMPDNLCHWNKPFTNSMTALHNNVCWKNLPNVFGSGATVDLSAADSTAPCKTASSNPATCTTDKQCYANTTDHLLYWCTATNTWTAVATAAAYTTVQDEASPLTARRKLNFTGDGISCVDNSGSSRTDCTIGNIYSTIKDEASSLTQRPTINFIGTSIDCVDNSGSTRTDCTVSGGTPGGSNGDLQINDSGTGFAGYAGADCGTDCVQSISTSGAVTCGTCTGTGNGYDTIKDEGSTLATETTLNFTGAGVSCVDNSGAARTDCTVAGTKAQVQEEGSDLAIEPNINFIGTAMTCVDNSGSSRTDCTVTAPAASFEAPDDAVPNSAGTIDDEFNDNSFSGWTAVNTSENGSTCTTTEASSSFVRINCSKLTSGSFAGHQFMKTPPSPPYTVKTRFNTSQTLAAPSNYMRTGLSIRNSSNGRTTFCGDLYNGEHEFSIGRMTINSGSTSFNANPVQLDWWRGPLPVEYWKMDVTSTGFTCYAAVTGEGPWQFIGTETFSSWITGSGGSADQVGMMVELETSGTDLEIVWYWIRSDV